jgi:hypothetical protein
VATPPGTKSVAKDTVGVAGALAEAPLGPQARALLTPEHTAGAYVEALVAAGLLEDAVRATAFLLPRREAIWWAARCVRSVPAAVTDPKASAALAATEKWAAEPTDPHRRTAFVAAEAVGFGTPAGALGAAVFFAEGSLAPPKQAAVPAAPHLAPTTAANAVRLAAVIVEPERAADRLRQFVALGAEVAAGRDRWPESRPAAGAPGSPRPAAGASIPSRQAPPPRRG